MLHPVDAQGESGDDELSVTMPDRPSGAGLLVVKRGPNAGTRFVLAGDVTRAGRHPESDIFLDDITVSRRHAEFVGQNGVYSIRDVGSLNGTYVNRERIEEAVLATGDEVQIGKFKLVYLAAVDE
jgi:pSer/pThr/pTyr-binding forkhead associated (FHA) protein